MGAVFRWIKYIYEWCKNFALAFGGANGVGEIDALAGIGKGVNFFVDGDNGSDDYDGKSWDKAFATIQKAITTSNALADWTWKKLNTIWVMPGDYPENLDGDILMTHIIGLGIRGTDTMVKIHPATGSVLAKVAAASCNLVGAHLANLRFEVDEVVPILDIEVANSSLIEHCQFYTIEAVAPTGIDTENSNHLEIRHCDFGIGGGPGLAYGMYFRGGANKFLHNARIHDNKIFADVGIWIEGTCTASEAVIQHNKIVAGTIGVDDNSGGSYVIDNFISSLPGDAIDHAGGISHTIGNRIIDTGEATGAWEA